MADSKAKQVRNYIQTLDRNDRYIVLLYYADGLTPMEISRVLDLPSNAVRTRLQELKVQLAGLTQPKARSLPANPAPTNATQAYA